jgi:hypothetical protein
MPLATQWSFPCKKIIIMDTPPHSLKVSNVSSEMKTTKGGIGVCSLVHNTLGVEGRVGAPRWGLRQMTSGSIIHTNLHKPNNKLVSAWFEHFWCMDEHGHTRTHKTHHNPSLGETITFSLIIFFVINHGATFKCHFVLGLPSWESQNFQNYDF